MTSATDELRRMLDERGVEWEKGLPTETIVREPIDVLYVERPDGRMHAYVRSYFTPAQAIAATLGNEGVGRSNDGVAELEAENARLRELVRGLLSGYACGRGRLCDECSWDGLGDPHTFACPVRVRARELGVEVNDG